MSRRQRQLEVWLAALDAGHLADDDRIRLQEALEQHPEVAVRARGISRVVSELQDDPPGITGPQLDRLSQGVADALRANKRPDRTAAAPRRRRLQWAVVGALAAASVAAVLLHITLDREPIPANPGPKLKRARAKNAPPAPRLTATRWEVLAARRVQRSSVSRSRTPRPQLGVGARLAVGEDGHALLRNGGRFVVARGGATLKVLGDREIELTAGRLEVVTANRDSVPLVVRTAGWRVEPVGTVFALAAAPRRPHVVVAEGSVRLTSPEGTVELLLAGSRPEPEQARLNDLASKLRAGAGDAALLQVHPTALLRDEDQPSRTARARRARRPRRTRRYPGLAEVEDLLRQGSARAARRRAVQLLARTRSPRRRQLLRLFIAESYLREGSYREARRRYLHMHRLGRRSTLGAEALYMVGSIEVEHLGWTRRAERRFRDYLRLYRRGSQRQGAYYLLCRALVRRKQASAARRCAERYLRQYPRGQFRRELKRLVQDQD